MRFKLIAFAYWLILNGAVLINKFYKGLLILIFPLIFFDNLILAQQAVIDSISILGLKRTNKNVPLRDLFIKIGDTVNLNDLNEIKRDNQWQLLNSGIYASVEIIPVLSNSDSTRVNFDIYVNETLFFYPVPYFELVDRNFNVWYKEYRATPRRINFGAKLYFNNLTGQKDRLDILAHWGYHTKYEAEYTLPFINKAKTLGIQISGLWSQTREIAYNTTDKNIQERKLSDRILLKRIKTAASLIYQPKIRLKQRLQLGWRDFVIDPIVLITLNKDYLLTKNNKLSYLTLQYTIQYDKRNIKPHPNAGYLIEANFEKQGINDSRNALIASLDLKKYFTLFPGIILAEQFRTQVNLLKNKTDYYHNRALGEEAHFIRGYEYYLIDGQNYAYLKSNIQFLIYDAKWNLSKVMPFGALKKAPIQIFFTVNNDMGYIKQQEGFIRGQFNDRTIWGGGIGIEILVYYDKMIQFEYSFNQLFENDLFLHANLNF